MSEIANFRFSLRHGSLSELINNPESVNLYEPIIVYDDIISYGSGAIFHFGFKVESSNYKYWADVIAGTITNKYSGYSNWRYDSNDNNYILVDYTDDQSITVTEKVYIYTFLSYQMEDRRNSDYSEWAIWDS